MIVQAISDKTFEKSVLCEANRPVLLRFWAEWCGPCRQIAPIFQEFAKERRGDIKCVEVNIDENPLTPGKYGVRGIPTMLIFQEGKVVSTKIGALPRDTFFKWVDSSVFGDDDIDAPESDMLGIVQHKGMLRIVVLKKDGSYQFSDGADRLHRIIYKTGGIITTEIEVLRNAVLEFEDIINDSGVSEQNIHNFFERHPNFILNDEYKKAHSKIVLEREGDGPLVPDFVLEPRHKQQLCDILELKRPGAKFMVMKKNRIRFSADVYEACSQMKEYGDYFDSSSNRKLIERRYGLTAFRPKMILIIGRLGSISPIERRKADNLVDQNITVRTYDEILEKMRYELSRYNH